MLNDLSNIYYSKQYNELNNKQQCFINKQLNKFKL